MQEHHFACSDAAVQRHEALLQVGKTNHRVIKKYQGLNFLQYRMDVIVIIPVLTGISDREGTDAEKCSKKSSS
jgi:hypothetical protein